MRLRRQNLLLQNDLLELIRQMLPRIGATVFLRNGADPEIWGIGLSSDTRSWHTRRFRAVLTSLCAKLGMVGTRSISSEF